MSPRRKSKRRKRRTQSDILMSVIRNTPSKKPASISQIAAKSGATWRTTKKNVDMLTKAGVISKVKERRKKRTKYVKR